MTDRQAFALGALLGAGLATLPLAYVYRSWKRIG